MIQNRHQNVSKSASGGGLEGSWSLSGRLGRVLRRLGVVSGRLGCVWERLEGALRGVLGAFWGFLRMSWEIFRRLGPCGQSWGALERFGGVLVASWARFS